MYARIVIRDLIAIFMLKFKILNMATKDLNRLKIVLVVKKRTGVWLSEQLGVSPVTISKWCSNITHPTLPTLDRIAKLLYVDVKELLNSTEK